MVYFAWMTLAPFSFLFVFYALNSANLSYHENNLVSNGLCLLLAFVFMLLTGVSCVQTLFCVLLQPLCFGPVASIGCIGWMDGN